MNIIKLVTLCAFLVSVTASSQEISDNAIGLRLGDSDGFGAEISYQRSIGRYTRFELDLGFRDHRRYSAFKLAGVYQWIHHIDGMFNWYYGFGGGVGNVSFDRVPGPLGQAVEPDGGTFVFGAGDVGIECNLDFPLLLSLDFRPEVGIIGYDNFDNRFDFDIALGIRYQF